MPAKLLGAVLFAGMGLVFFLIYALAKDRQRFGWALVPTASLWVMALVALSSQAGGSNPALGDSVPFWANPADRGLGYDFFWASGFSRSSRPAPALVLATREQPSPSKMAARVLHSVYLPSRRKFLRLMGNYIQRLLITLVDNTTAPDF